MRAPLPGVSGSRPVAARTAAAPPGFEHLDDGGLLALVINAFDSRKRCPSNSQSCTGAPYRAVVAC
jgi:hypothetical protein